MTYRTFNIAEERKKTRGIVQEITAKCPDCREKYITPDLWQYCPMCGTHLDVTVNVLGAALNAGQRKGVA